MSTHFNVYCETCGEAGPQIRRSPSGTKLLTVRDEKFAAGVPAAHDWAMFLIDHEYHELTLRHE